MAWSKTNDKTGTGSATCSTAAFTAALTNPSIIIAGVLATNNNTMVTPTDTAGNSYIDCGGGTVLFNGSVYSVALFYCLNTHTTASNAVSSGNSAAGFSRITAVEFTGGLTSSPVDTFHASAANSSTGSGGGQNCSSGAATTGTNGDLIVGMCSPTSGTITTGTGFTLPSNVTLEWQIQSTAGSIAATWHNDTNSDSYAALMIALKPAAGGGGSPLFRQPTLVGLGAGGKFFANPIV